MIRPLSLLFLSNSTIGVSIWFQVQITCSVGMLCLILFDVIIYIYQFPFQILPQPEMHLSKLFFQVQSHRWKMAVVYDFFVNVASFLILFDPKSIVKVIVSSMFVKLINRSQYMISVLYVCFALYYSMLSFTCFNFKIFLNAKYIYPCTITNSFTKCWRW